ncbi:hypothetical protein NHF46_17275 [Arthrobacter alpinus]|uniref:Uncharacterized protein n=1 Tax=Arthrobacter alpinus TaxID=656366 RepID=A0A0S2LXD2_9MICC|nr:hypothetical protein [Arthrobacter alpinus]ALO66141.1 hypothetical protein AS189_06085 [Arthrobacter alpinus]MDD0859007.1 hypothetical protein [Arthrobacter alpinus]
MASGYGEYISRAAQSEWMHSLRPNTAHIEFAFNNGDDGHRLLAALAHLGSIRTVGVEPGNGYYFRPRPTVVKRRFAYDRDIIRAIDFLGCFFPDSASSEQWTELGDVDVVFLDKWGKMLGATVTHEGMIITPEDEDEDRLSR